MTFREGLEDLTVIGHIGKLSGSEGGCVFRRDPTVCRTFGEIYRRKGEKSSEKGEKRGIRGKNAKKRGFSSKWSEFFSGNLLTFRCVVLHYGKKSRPGGEMADATDLKSVGTSMRVRVPPRAFFRKNTRHQRGNRYREKDGKRKKTQKNSLFLATYTIKDKNLSLICNDAPHHQKNQN